MSHPKVTLSMIDDTQEVTFEKTIRICFPGVSPLTTTTTLMGTLFDAMPLFPTHKYVPPSESWTFWMYRVPMLVGPLRAWGRHADSQTRTSCGGGGSHCSSRHHLTLLRTNHRLPASDAFKQHKYDV